MIRGRFIVLRIDEPVPRLSVSWALARAGDGVLTRLLNPAMVPSATIRHRKNRWAQMVRE